MHMHRCVVLVAPCRPPPVVSAVATAPTLAVVTINPASTGEPATAYTVTLCPAGGGACVTATCPTTTCLVPGLAPGTKYNAKAVAIQGGSPSPSSPPVEVTTPAAGAPSVTSAVPTTATTAAVTLDPPAGVVFTSVSWLDVPHDWLSVTPSMGASAQSVRHHC